MDTSTTQPETDVELEPVRRRPDLADFILVGTCGLVVAGGLAALAWLLL